MFCWNCGKEFVGNSCPYCGAPAHQSQQGNQQPPTPPPQNHFHHNQEQNQQPGQMPNNRPPMPLQGQLNNRPPQYIGEPVGWNNGNTKPTPQMTAYKNSSFKTRHPGLFVTLICIVGVVGFFLFICIIGILFSDSSDSSNNYSKASISSSTQQESKAGNENTESPEPETKPALEPFEIDLGAGNYIVGKDIPVGKYNLEAIKGGGNVSSGNIFSDGINEIMGEEEDDLYIRTYNNLRLKEGQTLEISNDLVLHLDCKEADVQNMQARTIGDEKEIELKSGNYVSGEDFEPGYYTVICTGSSGNVSSSNMFDGGMNEIMGKGNDGFTVNEFKNANFPEGTELEISGTSVKLIPVGK